MACFTEVLGGIVLITSRTNHATLADEKISEIQELCVLLLYIYFTEPWVFFLITQILSFHSTFPHTVRKVSLSFCINTYIFFVSCIKENFYAFLLIHTNTNQMTAIWLFFFSYIFFKYTFSLLCIYV